MIDHRLVPLIFIVLACLLPLIRTFLALACLFIKSRPLIFGPKWHLIEKILIVPLILYFLSVPLIFLAGMVLYADYKTKGAIVTKKILYSRKYTICGVAEDLFIRSVPVAVQQAGFEAQVCTSDGSLSHSIELSEGLIEYGSFYFSSRIIFSGRGGKDNKSLIMKHFRKLVCGQGVGDTTGDA